MRVFIDTNILISAALSSSGTPFKAYCKAVSYPNDGIICEQNIDELRRIFNRKFPKKIEAMEKFLSLAMQSVELVQIPEEEVEQEKKIPLYKKIYKALKSDGYFILTDYFALSDTEEKLRYEEFVRLKKEQNIKNDEIYQIEKQIKLYIGNIPLTVEHEIQALRSGGFSSVKILNK